MITDGSNKNRANSSPRKNRFDYHRSCHYIQNIHSNYSDDWHKRVAQPMPNLDMPSPKTFGHCGFYIVIAHLIQTALRT